MSDISFSRKLGARAPLLAAVMGMSLTLSSVVFFFVEDDFRRILGVTAGLFCLLLAIWYAANPFIAEERNYPELRNEVDGFIDLTRQLHNAAIRGDTAEFEAVRMRMPDQVESVIATARMSRAPGSQESDG